MGRTRLYEPVPTVGKGLTINSENIEAELDPKSHYKNKQPFDFTLRTNVLPPPWKHNYQPVHFANNSWNEHQALKARVLCKVLKPNPNFTKFYREVVISNLHILLPGIRNIKSLSFKNYLLRSNASPQVKQVLQKTHDELTKLGITENSSLSQELRAKWTMRKCFTKIENVLYKTPKGTKKKAPRLISGAQPEFVVLVGPWIMAFQDALKEKWNIDFNITFSSGMCGEDMGKWMMRNKNLPKRLEDDIGKFDASVSADLLRTEAEVFERCGAPTAVRQLIRANIKTHGKTRFGTTFRCRPIRKSGDPYTSCGNSMMNAFLHIVSKMIMSEQTCAQALRSMCMLVQGDDNVLLHKGPKIDWKSCMREFGFDSEAIYRDSIYKINFCSGRFIPVKEGIILAPKPGRVISKLGVFVNAGQQDHKVIMKSVLTALAINLGHVPGITKFVDSQLKGEKVSGNKRLDWELWLKKKQTTTAETLFWLDYHYLKWPGYVNVEEMDAHWERVYEMDSDGPPLFYTNS